jgi:16S rRNA C967 or C1407 C5-methylase (RsmB/RsmF family)
MNNMTTTNTLPAQLLERWKEMYSARELKQLLHVLSQEQSISFRTNTLITNEDNLEDSLSKKGFLLEKLKWYSSAFILKNKSVSELTETEEYKNGLLYIQNLSSMIPPVIMDPKPNEKILDLTAAPGSKSTQIAMLTNNNAQIVANDSSRSRLYKMERILHDYGIPFQKLKGNQIFGKSEFLTDAKFMITNFRGERFWKMFPEYFDKTLVDVPCSMEGRIRCDDPKSYKDWSIKKIKQLSKLQRYLLRSAVSATRVGGTITYSTCTLTPEENEEVIEWVVDKTPEALSVEKINIPHLPLQPGLTSWKKKQFTYTANCARVFPTQTMEGFFVAKLYKKASTLL